MHIGRNMVSGETERFGPFLIKCINKNVLNVIFFFFNSVVLGHPSISRMGNGKFLHEK